jgi:hypothetical protein
MRRFHRVHYAPCRPRNGTTLVNKISHFIFLVSLFISTTIKRLSSYLRFTAPDAVFSDGYRPSEAFIVDIVGLDSFPSEFWRIRQFRDHFYNTPSSGQAGSSLLLYTPIHFLPLFLLTFLPSSASSLISLPHVPTAPSPSGSLSPTLSHRSLLSPASSPSKYFTIQPCSSSTSVIVYTHPPGRSTNASSSFSCAETMRALCLCALKCGSEKEIWDADYRIFIP